MRNRALVELPCECQPDLLDPQVRSSCLARPSNLIFGGETDRPTPLRQQSCRVIRTAHQGALP